MSNHAYLAHHGIKGQKWGVRRFQNDDGSYTSAGKRRYSKGKTALVEKRQSMIDSANTEINRFKTWSKEDQETLKNLKKEGSSGKTFSSLYDPEGKGYDAETFKKMLGYDKEVSFNQTLKEFEKSSKEWSDQAKKWMQQRDDLMNLNVDKLSKRKLKKRLNSIEKKTPGLPTM